MKFINRKQELDRLNKLAKRPSGGIAVIWGRRRVGKSRLLLEWVRKHRGVYYMADESAAPLQRKRLAAVFDQILPGFSEVEYPDWLSLFLRLSKEATRVKWRGPIVIDELPYLIATSPELPSILQNFVDREAKKGKLILALCGSSQRMMQGAILDASAPLYGRADELIKLKPISVGYVKEALQLRSPRAIVETYAVWGGIPRYWELVEKNSGSFWEQIDQLVLDPMGPLNDEPHRLLLEESPSAIGLRPILDAIGLGSHRLSEIAARIGQPITSLARPIQRLIELDLIQRETPFGTDKHNSKRTLYDIQDPFARFWFKVVAPQRSLLAQLDKTQRILLIKEKMQPIFSKIWEEICRLAVPHLPKRRNGIPWNVAGRFWHGQGAEWDLIAESIDRSSLLVGEAKWTAKDPTAHWIRQAANELKKKGIPPVERKTGSKVVYALFVTKKPLKLPPLEGVIVFDAKDILTSLKR
jgi:AAA+ ATPase superfamily predicted ATPase